MIIVARGDSMIWGSELQDSPHGGPEWMRLAQIMIPFINKLKL